MPSNRLIGNLLLIGVVLVMIPYSTLTVLFDYPNILRQHPGVVLTRFHIGGPRLIAVWWLFAIGGLPLLEAYILIGQKLEKRLYFIRWATTLGIISLIVQMIGLMRWPFVVPVLAQQYVATTDPAARQAITVVFSAIHQYGGVVLGEHIGQLFTIAYTILLSSALLQLKLLSRWVGYLGYVASGVYLLAQGELFKTVIPAFPNWALAGLLGSTLWLVWLVVVAIQFRVWPEINP